MTKNIVTDIYNATIGSLLANVDEKEAESMENAYQGYLQDRYGILPISDSNYDRIIGIYIKGESDKWSAMSVDGKRAYLFRDASFSELAGLSGEAESYARARLESKSIISEEKASQMIARMKELVDKVEPYNKDMALIYLSEGSVDCIFASGKSNNTSIRLSSERPVKSL